MGAAVRLRTDYDGARLRDLAKRSRNGAQARRLLALAEIYDGRRRSDAARLAGVGLQIIRDWVLRFNAEGPDGLINRKGSGPPSRLTDDQRAKLRAAVEDGPKPYLDGMVRWRLVDLAAWVRDEFGISISESAMSRTLKALGFAKLSARPRHHAQNELAAEHFKKDFPPSWQRSRPGSRSAQR